MSETVINQNQEEQQQRKQDAPILERKDAHAGLRKTIGIILCIIMVGLSIYVLDLESQNFRTLAKTNELFAVSSVRQATNYRTYVIQYKETKAELDETTRKLAMVTAELDRTTAELSATKGMLSDMQTLLNQTQGENLKLRQEIQELEGLSTTENVKNLPELEAKISSLKRQNAQVTTELGGVKNELRAFQGDFNTIEEGKSLLTLFRSKINLVKSRMRYLRQEAYMAKVSAQKERDRVETLNGNSGFLLRDGQSQKPAGTRGFAIDVKMLQ